MKNTKSEWIVIKRSKIHTEGLFAKKDIPKGTKIIEYVGEKITVAEALDRNEEHNERAKTDKKAGAVYIFNLNSRYCIDGSFSWNTANLVNHSCDPNCIYKITRGHIWIIAKREIKKGEEVTMNYGFALVKSFKEHPCKCGAKNCVGYIVDKKYWPKLKRWLKK